MPQYAFLSKKLFRLQCTGCGAETTCAGVSTFNNNNNNNNNNNDKQKTKSVN